MGHSHLRGDISNFSHSHVEDTGWLALPALQNGWTQYPSWEIAEYRRLNGIVIFKGLLAPGTTTAGTLMFTMPEGFRNIGPSHTPIAAGSTTGGALNIYGSASPGLEGQVFTNYGCTGWVSLNGVWNPADS